jgi:aryl-alcohol dehydrogenase-like predicted oxidoreductase
MGSGLLTGAMTRERIAKLPADDWRARSPAFREPALTVNLRIADRLKEIGARHGWSAGQSAIAWTLRNPAVTGAIVGARDAAQVDGVMSTMDLALTDGEAAELER